MAGARNDDARPYRQAQTALYLAAALGIVYALLSVYWGLGGRALLSTVGGTIAERGQSGDAAFVAAVWGAAVLKLIAVVLPFLAVGSSPRGLADGLARHLRLLTGLAWSEAVILIAYGGVLTLIGVLVQLGIVLHGRHADTKALAWHAFLWDPWFLVWGVCVALGLRAAAARRRLAAAR